MRLACCFCVTVCFPCPLFWTKRPICTKFCMSLECRAEVHTNFI
jgi:hypothetical protein